MRKIDFKSGRYILPLIVLPFLFIFNYLYLDTFQPVSTDEQLAVMQADTTTLNTSLPDANLAKRPVMDKFNASQQEHKYRTDYSAIRGLEQTKAERAYGSAYTAEEQAMLDSINNQILSNKPSPGFMERVGERQDRERYTAAPARRPAVKRESDYEKEMRLFREQMAYVDSLGRAGSEPERKAATAPKPEPKEPEALAVRKTLNPNIAYFNTVGGSDDEQFIKAMLDEGLKVRDGGRIRVRLLDAIYVGETQIDKGSYLYGTVTGFSAQRVEVTVSSILVGDEILPVRMSIYDNDGMKGLYVPDSQFRNFTKELGSNASSGQSITFGDNPDNSAQMLYAMMDRMAQTATQAAGKSIRKNKARLKYNTVVYLIDNKAKK
ncbi:conjugative transposon protein TraM [Pontibacter akesuensis]|uniref:Bacteroides conjugative transposon TraM protein n=1 Tax=Pontibacter akesuensis TaxID=388950 RepID=A0A1I7KP64_9BACT|nr:conjugative transposon protein TraM [Pontibacter akesuensis]GHA81758.1 conjugative transposon protein TraM [Pontibacter akesuensis]SFU99233.1 Bacteroides conjugative transposon TraM protein [Pontibacter akesuensis]